MNLSRTQKKSHKLNQIKNKKFEKILIITGKNSFKMSGANNLLQPYLIKKNVKIFYKKRYLPEIRELKKIIETRNRFKPDLIIAIGGGSVIDYSKICNLVWTDESLEKNILKNKLKKIRGKYCKLLALPTTAGSGAEVTSGAVIYIKGTKFSIDSHHVKPNSFFLSASLHKKLNKKIRATTGLDAISQAIESLISVKSNNKSIFFAKKSLKLSFEFFLKSLKNPTNYNLYQMSLAANLAGKAIDISKTTAPHALSYYFTEKHNVSHGQAVFLTLVQFLRYNYFKLPKKNNKFKNRFNIMIKLSKNENFDEFINFLEKIKRNTKLDFNFYKLGIDLKKEIKNILNEVNQKRLANNPIKLNNRIIKNILLNN